MNELPNHHIVSFNSEPLILVDENDCELGFQDKLTCHHGRGILHRAFSIFIFNEDGELLLHQRSADKHLWPLYWSNSCCSHPRQGESIDEAAQRRLQEELGFSTELTYVYKFKYQVPYLDIGSEHELCSVYLGKSNQTVRPNKNEIADWRFISRSDLEKELVENPEQFTPWFKLEWQCLKQDFPDILKKFRY